MEFLCLNCFETFDVSEYNLPEPGGVLKCPVCGHKQPFAGVKTQKTTTGSHRRASGEYHMSSTDGKNEPGLQRTTTSRARRPVIDKKSDTTGRKTTDHQAPTAQPGSSYNVVSPSGLSFDFQDLQMLVRWGEMVANPVPYQVYRDGKEDAVSLEELLNDKSSIRKFKKRAAKMQQAAEAEAATLGEPDNTDDKGSKPAEKRTRPLTTREFQFKTDVVEEKKWPMMVIYLVLSAFFGAAALFAIYVYFFHGG